MLDSFIKKKKKYTTMRAAAKKADIPQGMFIKCPCCKKNIYVIDLLSAFSVCMHCDHHMPMSPKMRISKIVDKGTFREFDKQMKSENPLDFPGYEQKVQSYIDKTDENEAVITGEGKIDGIRTVIAIMDPRFMMGSMGSVVGEKITRAIEYATDHSLPIIIFTASGGARMQEGIYSLMQMAKTSAALARHDERGLLYISVLTDPTTGGVTASFAMLGDIIIAEPNALIAFAGPRVIEQTIKEKLPQGFQRAEFLLEHGMIDYIAHRKDMRNTLSTLLRFHVKEGQ